MLGTPLQVSLQRSLTDAPTPWHCPQELSLHHCTLHTQGFDCILSDMLQSTNGVNDVELSLDLAGTALNIATGHYYELYGEQYAAAVGFTHSGFLKPGGSLVMKIYEVRWAEAQGLCLLPGMRS
jgi:hypothetical protein